MRSISIPRLRSELGRERDDLVDALYGSRARSPDASIHFRPCGTKMGLDFDVVAGRPAIVGPR